MDNLKLFGKIHGHIDSFVQKIHTFSEDKSCVDRHGVK